MFYPEASNTVIFVIMAIVLLIKPAGLFGTAALDGDATRRGRGAAPRGRGARHQRIAFAVMVAFFVAGAVRASTRCS